MAAFDFHLAKQNRRTAPDALPWFRALTSGLLLMLVYLVVWRIAKSGSVPPFGVPELLAAAAIAFAALLYLAWTRPARSEAEVLYRDELATGALDRELQTAMIVENSADIISRQSPAGVILYVSRACRQILGYDPADLIGRSCFEFLHPDQIGEIRALHIMLMTQKQRGTLSYQIRRHDGAWIWLETTSQALVEHGEIREIVSVSREITDRKRIEEQIEHQVYHDPLTDLPNRVLLEDRASMALARARRNQTAAAVLFLDLDRFKNVNDTLGHAAGDEVLQSVANRLRECVREADTLARVGGDEFVVIADLHEIRDAATIAQKIISSMRRPFFLGKHEIQLGISIGIAVYPIDGTGVDMLLRAADRAMYRAKLTGGDTYEMYTAGMSAEAADILALESDLRHAIERGELEVEYQPQVDLATGSPVAVEALARWRHPTRGLLPPDTFIPLAENTKLISALGEFVLRRACSDLQRWRANGAGDIRVAVNVSAMQFRDRKLVDTVSRVLGETKLPPHLLELEITETALMTAAEMAAEPLEQLRRMRVHLAIDDFGTGYSSLSYLRRFPVDCVKIDRSFVSGLDATGGDAAIVSAVIGLGRALDLRVVAEGVETERQAEILQTMGCDLAQGFLFARPVRALEIEALLKSGKPQPRAALC